MAGECELVVVLSRGQCLVCVSCCCSLRRPMVGVCELVAVMSGGQWFVCVSCCCSLRRPIVWLLFSHEDSYRE